MKKRFFKGSLLLVVILIGCAHYVDFNSPDLYLYESAVPLKIVFYMDKNMKDKMYSSRTHSGVYVFRWDVPIGNVVHQYAIAYLKNGFKDFNETENLSAKPSYDFLIKVIDINYYMKGQAAHCDLVFNIENSSGKEVLNKKYHADGPSGFGRVFAGGPFAQKSAIRQSTHVVMETIFKNLVDDIRKDYTSWQ